MAHKIKFGTDGWRGEIADDYTFANVRRCAHGFARHLLKNYPKDSWVVIGYDKRFQSEKFAAAAAEVMAGNGFRVYITESATPTPVISYSIVNKQAVGGINITASHNPPHDNGFKVRNEFGGAIDPNGLSEIESVIPPSEDMVNKMPLEDAERKGRIVYFDPAPAYIKQIHRLIDLKPIQDAGIHVLVDPMWGNGAGWFQKLIGGGKTKITEIHNIRNPSFPEMKRPEPIPPNIDVALRATLEHHADVLIVTDGDADRLGIGDENGNFIDQLRAYGLLAYYLLEIRGQNGAIVKTLSTTKMLNKLGKIYDVPVFETGVGFKFVAPKMLETDAMIGGEESGGYAFRNHVPERDGILAGIYILDMMVRTGKKPSQLLETLFEVVGAHYYDRIDTRFEGDRKAREQIIRNSNPKSIGGLEVTGLDTTDGYKFSLEDGGWLLIRFSGTEPIIRVYTETTHKNRVTQILDDGLRVAGINKD
ncbi:MAG: phosphoglucomutase/phosphomannomutase family protein [Anaerolineales bacterium]|nr:MAG: phosphoglucomutase/phosphomannomutase family protein [Anaerolineales bacterium]